MIKFYKDQLKEYLTNKEIELLDQRIKNHRNWYNVYFEKKYREKVLYNVLSAYRKTGKISREKHETLVSLSLTHS